MNYLAFRVQKIQGKEEAAEDNGEDRRRQPSHGVAVEESQDALPQRGVHQTAVRSIRPGYLERVEELPDTAAAGMPCRCRRDSLVHGDLMVDLGTETLGVYKELQRDMAATDVSELAPVNISRRRRSWEQQGTEGG